MALDLFEIGGKGTRSVLHNQTRQYPKGLRGRRESTNTKFGLPAEICIRLSGIEKPNLKIWKVEVVTIIETLKRRLR